MARYGSQVLRALGDVESALATSQVLAQRVTILGQVVSDQQKTLEYEQASYRFGRADMRGPAAAAEVQAAQINYLRARSEELSQRVNLHLVLGGNSPSRSRWQRRIENPTIAP